MIRFNPDLTGAAHLLRVLDQARIARRRTMTRSALPESQASDWPNSSLALAVAGEMAAPLLLPACAVLLVGSNLRTFRAAGRQLMRGQFGLPVLYTAIVAATLASGQFIASAAMSWMFTFWNRAVQKRPGKRPAQARRPDHPASTLRQACNAQDRRESTSRSPIEDLQPNDVILVSAGELIPTDGRVLDGRGLVDERMVHGPRGPFSQTARRPGLRRLDLAAR